MTIKTGINYFGEWSQNVVIGLLTGLISGIFVALIFELPRNPEQITPYLIAFGTIIFLIVIVNWIIQWYRECVNKRSDTPQQIGKIPITFRIPVISYLIAVIIVLIVVGAGSIIAPSIFISPLMGAIVGAIIALLSAKYMFQIQQNEALKTISRGFYVELECYQTWMKPWVKFIIASESLLGVNTLPLTGFVNIHRPFFDNDSLYYSFRKEMFQFDKEISEKLFRIYSLIKGAEESRLLIVQNFEHFHPDVQRENYEHIKQNFQQALQLIDEVKQKFDEM